MASRTPSRWWIILPALGAVTLLSAACSNNSGNSNSHGGASSTSSSTSSSVATTTSTASTTSTSSTTSGTLVPQTSTGTEFYSPSQNISCEIDSNFGSTGHTQTLCLTVNPPRSVVLGTDGSLTECTGQQCLSNAGLNTPTLGYGQSISLGPFTCSSATSGITCTVSNGDGFLISTSGVTPQGNATIKSS